MTPLISINNLCKSFPGVRALHDVRFELLSGEDAITTYKFGSGVAKHTFCKHCGIHSFYTPRSAPDGISVNVRCLDDVDVETVRGNPFDGRHWEDAMRARLESGNASDVTGVA